MSKAVNNQKPAQAKQRPQAPPATAQAPQAPPNKVVSTTASSTSSEPQQQKPVESKPQVAAERMQAAPQLQTQPAQQQQQQKPAAQPAQQQAAAPQAQKPAAQPVPQQPQQETSQKEQQKENEPVVAPPPTKGAVAIKPGLYYLTGWDKVVLHGSKDGGEWKDFPLKQDEMRGDWWYFELPTDAKELEFVMTTESKTEWDKSPANGNYKLTPSAKAVYTLVGGQLVEVAQAPRCLLVVDLDGTYLGHWEFLRRLEHHWQSVHQWRGSKLVFNTGRNLKDLLKASAEWQTVRPDGAVCCVGTEIYTFLEKGTASRPLADLEVGFSAEEEDAGTPFPAWCPSRDRAQMDKEWADNLRKRFDRAALTKTVKDSLASETVFINGNSFHDPFRLSLSAPIEFLDNPVCDAEGTKIAETGLKYLEKLLGDQVKLIVSGGGDWKYVDVLDKSVDKLKATMYLASKWGFDASEILVCGDSGNDIDLFGNEKVLGCCVSNADEDLMKFLKDESSNQKSISKKIHFSELPNAGGILDGLRHHGFDTSVPV